MKIINLSKRIFIFALVVGLFALVPQKVEAYKVSPEKATYDKITKNITIVAKPPSTPVNAVKINIRVQNARVTYYTPPTGGGWLSPIGECTGQKRWLDNSVCLSIAKTTNIRSGESLGVINIEFTTYGTATISINGESYYTNGDQKFSTSGTIGTYTIKRIVTPTSTPKPTPSGEVTPTPSISVTPSVSITPTVSGTPGVSETPSGEPTVSPTIATSPASTNVPVPTKKPATQSKTGNTLLLLFVGGLMLLGALFGFAMLLIRRKKDPVEEAFPVYNDPNGPGGYSTGDYSTTF